nr:MAG TPA: hypothetical protein [Caudoviricetes sp.]
MGESKQSPIFQHFKGIVPLEYPRAWTEHAGYKTKFSNNSSVCHNIKRAPAITQKHSGYPSSHNTVAGLCPVTGKHAKGKK